MKYFVSYSFKKGNGYGYGNGVYGSERTNIDEDLIREIEEYINNKNGNDGTVILNFSKI